MNHFEMLQKLKRLQSLLQELSVLESKMVSINSAEESFANTTNQNSVLQDFKSPAQISSTALKQQKFVDACKMVFLQFQPMIQIEDNMQLCSQIDNISLNQRQFWTSVHKLIPEKSATQLKEYYQKCFSKVKYEAKISEEDKNTLKQLSIQMKDNKPAEVVSHFLKLSNNCNKYFKRTLVMFVVYMRR
ncbi:Hypothetical_protein [Hexamita inflata]|uniref:Hypothetical_protein n=1 Tax=Hexamita inflata TaxID=28002 RepID=A0AA86Q5L2_9EUKA|nr:Hypothetical protein HINF_LOCUS37422 [Hexamita inflata]